MHLNVLQVYVQIDLSLENLELFPAFVLFGISASLQSYKLNVFALQDANTVTPGEKNHACHMPELVVQHTIAINLSVALAQQKPLQLVL